MHKAPSFILNTTTIKKKEGRRERMSRERNRKEGRSKERETTSLES